MLSLGGKQIKSASKNMSAESWITVVSLIVTGSVSALALWLSFRERRSNFRNTLYAKQIEAYMEIIQAANQVMVEAFDMADYALHMSPAPHDLIADGEEKVATSKMHFREIRRKWILFLPPKVQNALNAFDKSVSIMSYWDLTDFDGTNEPFEVDRQYVLRIKSAYNNFVEAAREAIGTDPLSAETMTLLGKIRKRRLSSAKF